MRILLKILLLLSCFIFASYAFGADSTLPDENIHIKADSMSHGQMDGIITASGNVLVTWQGISLASDKASYDSNAKILHATGNVMISKGNDVIKGESIKLNIENGWGEMDKASLSIPNSSLSLKGEKIFRLSETEYEVSNSELTTCELPDPSWKFGAGKLKVNVLGYATGRNIIFYIKDVPVLYLPWIAFPVVREKKSGLLFPRFGYSNTRGAQLDIPLYLVISPSQDILLDLDLLSKRGTGTGMDYRYIRTRGSEGHISGYQIYDLSQNRWRWQIGQSHKEIFSPDMTLRVDVNLNSDRTFLSDYGEKSGEYNRQSSDTTLNALKTWQHYALATHLRFVEDLYAADNSRTLQTLPEVSVAGVRQRFFDLPLYFDIDAGIANLYREVLSSGQRLRVFPRVTLLQSQNGLLNASFFAGAHINGYHNYKGNNERGIQQNDGVMIPEAGARLSTSFSRVYQLETSALKKLRHEIIPEITYSYVPDHSQQRLPFYDYTDRQVWQNMAYMSVTSLLNGKFVTGETSQYRDISRIKLMLGYSFEGTRQDLLTLVDSRRRWTDLILESDTWVHPLVRLTLDARYNTYDRQISSSATGVEFDDKQGNSIGASYRIARNELDYLDGRLSTRLIKPMILSYTARYSFDRGDFLESVYSAEYRHKCWSIILALHERPGRQSFTVNFNLAGLTNNPQPAVQKVQVDIPAEVNDASLKLGQVELAAEKAAKDGIKADISVQDGEIIVAAGQNGSVPVEIYNRGGSSEEFLLEVAAAWEYGAFLALADKRDEAVKIVKLAPGEAFKGRVFFRMPAGKVDGHRESLTVKAISLKFSDVIQVKNIVLIASAPHVRVVAKFAGQKVTPGERLRYRISVLNAGSQPAQDLTVRLKLSPQLELVDTPYPKYTKEQNGTLVFSIERLDTGKLSDISLDVRVKRNSPVGQELQSQVEVVNAGLQRDAIFTAGVTVVQAKDNID